MSIEAIKQEIELEIARLQKVLALLSGLGNLEAGAVKKLKPAAAASSRRISEAGRRRIAEAQRKRWQKARRGRKQEKWKR